MAIRFLLVIICGTKVLRPSLFTDRQILVWNISWKPYLFIPSTSVYCECSAGAGDSNVSKADTRSVVTELIDNDEEKTHS